MSGRITPREVTESAWGVLEDWFEYDYPKGPDGPQFRVRRQDDGSWMYSPVDRGSFAVHPEDEGGVRFMIKISVERMD